jgi:hypothetical protein
MCPPSFPLQLLFTHCDRAETERRTGGRQRSADALVAPNSEQTQRQVSLIPDDDFFFFLMLLTVFECIFMHIQVYLYVYIYM